VREEGEKKVRKGVEREGGSLSDYDGEEEEKKE